MFKQLLNLQQTGPFATIGKVISALILYTDVARLFLSYGLGIVVDWKTKVLVTPPPMHDSDYNDVVRILVGHS